MSKQRNEDEARVDDFIQIIVFCPPEPRVGAFVYRNTRKVYGIKNILISFYRRSKTNYY